MEKGLRENHRFNMMEEWKKLIIHDKFLKRNYILNRISNICDVLLINLFEGNISDIHSRVTYKNYQ